MGVRRKSDCGRIGKIELPRDMRLRRGNDLSEDKVPFPVKQTRGIAPNLFLGRQGHVRPRMMTVRRRVQRRARQPRALRKAVHCGDFGPAAMSGSWRCAAFQTIALWMRVRPDGW